MALTSVDSLSPFGGLAGVCLAAGAWNHDVKGAWVVVQETWVGGITPERLGELLDCSCFCLALRESLNLKFLQKQSVA